MNIIKKTFSFIEKKLSKIGKRKRFIFATILLTVSMLYTTFYRFDEVPILLPALVIAVYVLSYFSFLVGISKIEWIMLFLPQIFFSIVYYLFYFFIPARWLTRLPFGILYAISIYALLLSQNIFNIGVEKSLQLYRAAFSVNYLFLTISMFLASSIVLSFGFNFYVVAGLLGIISFPLTLHYLWSINPKTHIERNDILYSFIIMILICEVALFGSFTPIDPSVFALLITGVFYSLSGMFGAYIQDKLFTDKIREYVYVLIFIIAITILSLRW